METKIPAPTPTPTFNKNFCKQISPEEYNNSQQSEYTKNQLKLLEQQLLENNFNKKSDDDDVDDDISESDYEDDEDVDDEKQNRNKLNTNNNSKTNLKTNTNSKTNLNLNISLDKILNKSIPKKTVKNNSLNTLNPDELVNTLILQNEKYQKKILELKVHNKKIENTNHYTKLDLCTAQVTVNELRDKIKEQTILLTSIKYQNLKLNIYLGLSLLFHIYLLFYFMII
jgi:hypothetical protein